MEERTMTIHTKLRNPSHPLLMIRMPHFRSSTASGNEAVDSAMEQKILLFHQGALGDVFLTLSALRRVQGSFAFDICCQGSLGALLKKLQLVHRVFPVEQAQFASLFSGKPAPGFTKLFAEYHSLILFSFSATLEATVRAATDRPLYRLMPRPMPHDRVHITNFLLQQLKRLAPALSIASNPPLPAGGHLEPALPTTILLHPGSGSPRKNWPLNRFQTLARNLRNKGFQAEWMLGPAEHALYTTLINAGSPTQRVHRISDLLDFHSLLERVLLFVGNDSGLGHVAAFTGRPTAVIFGPSDPLQWHPVGPQVAVVSSEHVCPPCHGLPDRDCHAPLCLQSILPAQVEEAIETLLSSAASQQPARHPERGECWNHGA